MAHNPTPQHLRKLLREHGFAWGELDSGVRGWYAQRREIQVSVWLDGPGGGYGGLPPKSLKETPVVVVRTNEDTGKDTSRKYKTLAAFLTQWRRSQRR
jgi:hypothetical protein